MDQNAWTMLLLGIAVTSALFALGVVLYPKLKSEKQGYPFEAEIEAALLPLIFQGISAAYRLSEKSIDEIQLRISGSDKKKIADTIYRMLPEKIGPFDISVVKRVVTQERFETLVQNAFDNFDRFFVEHQKHFDDLFEKWKVENKPA
ncbi:MAG TPA: hypothetical protein DCX54_08645 [Flavobacteriales bacterium]|nr:hypothetical protein [Flavobacteriales bacterium]